MYDTMREENPMLQEEMYAQSKWERSKPA